MAGLPAVIDIGSNTVRLAVFEGLPPAQRRCIDDKASCGLGRDLGRTGRLVMEARASALEAIARMAARAAAAGADPPALIATAALREAEDGADFAAEIECRFGLPVTVLSGEEEARLVALGVAGGLPDADGAVADLGGGSLELVEVTTGRTGRSASLPLGHLRLFHQHSGETDAAAATAGETLAGLAWLAALSNRTLYVSGGSWRKLARRHIAARGAASGIDGYVLPGEEAASFARSLAEALNSVRRTAPAGSGPGSSSFAVAAAVFARLVALAAPASVVFSSRGLVDGWLTDRLAMQQPSGSPATPDGEEPLPAQPNSISSSVG